MVTTVQKVLETTRFTDAQWVLTIRLNLPPVMQPVSMIHQTVQVVLQHSTVLKLPWPQRLLRSLLPTLHSHARMVTFVMQVLSHPLALVSAPRIITVLQVSKLFVILGTTRLQPVSEILLNVLPAHQEKFVKPNQSTLHHVPLVTTAKA
jgi:hypothetical protein